MKKTICSVGIMLMLLSVGCTSKKNNSKSQKAPTIQQSSTQNSLTKRQEDNGWKLLFDGKTTKEWRKVWGKTFPDQGWIVKNGALFVQASNEKQGGIGGSIVTKNKYSDFIFKTDFKVFDGTNSGIKYFVVENNDFFQNNPDLEEEMGIGMEYQIIDEENDFDPQGGPNGMTASLYEMVSPDRNKPLMRGDWNHAKIISKGNHIEHWLNGEKVLEYERGGDNFNKLVSKSKYNKYENFGLAPKGHILLQNHGTKVAFKNIMIKKLDN